MMNTEAFRGRMQELINKKTFEGKFVFPDYESLNLKNVLPQIAAIFGVGSLNCSTLPGDCLAQVKGIKRVVLVLFDGLGYSRLLYHISSHQSTFAQFAEKGTLKPITTVFPSTTSTALTSLFSGLSPAQHQIIGYLMFSKKYALVYNTLEMKPVYGYSGRVELANDYAHTIKPLIPILEQNGVKTTLITKAHIIRSGLSHVTHRDIAPIPYLLGSDMWTHTVDAITKQDPCLSIVYYSGVDNLAHKYGPYSKETTFELTSIEHNLRDFIDALPEEIKKETLMVITGDHGIAEIKGSYYLRDNPQLMQHLLLPPVGDGRASYLFCKHGRKDLFAGAFEEEVEGFSLYPTMPLVEKGLFGQPINKEELKEKIGDFAALSHSDKLLEYPYFEEDREHPQKGAHGGLTAEEMVVPLLSVKLSDI